jgi:hypothetical protein
MARLIKLTQPGGKPIWINADKIVRLGPDALTIGQLDTGNVVTRIEHEPYHLAFGELDYVNVTESPEQIRDMCTEPATVIHIPAEDYR